MKKYCFLVDYGALSWGCMIIDSFFDKSPECLVISDMNGKILQFNNSFKNLFEKVEEGVLLAEFNFYAGGEKNIFGDGLQDYFEFDFDNRETTYTNETGYLLHFLLSSRKVVFKDEKALLLSFKNITDFVGYKTVFEDLYNNLTYKTNELDKVIREKEEAYQLLKEKDDELNRQLVLAGEIQSCFLPRKEQKIGEYSIASMLRPATVVSGDFYSIWHKEDNFIDILIADVTGHGVPSALITMLLKMSLETAIRTLSSPEQILDQLNSDLYKFLSDASIFLTLLLARIDIKTGRVKVINCGHIQPIIMRFDGNFEEVKINGMMLGVMEKLDYEVIEFTIRQGDTMLLYTDGIPEAQDGSGVFYEDSFLDKLRNLHRDTPKVIVKEIVDDVYRYAQKDELADDITLVCVKRN